MNEMREFVNKDGTVYRTRISKQMNEWGGHDCLMQIDDKGLIYPVNHNDYKEFVDKMYACSDVEFCMVIEHEMKWFKGLVDSKVTDGSENRKRVLH